ncbi:F-box domain-containing protein [Favolaschia claudopus]|uniref:F-box domain-containing protein n=1 Tax=Favolaschia claudopus TaxID=2862362 RepID=A0AAW0DQ01_9AGAR
MSAARTLRQLANTSARISSRQLCSASLVRPSLVAAKMVSRAPIASRTFSVSARALKAGSSDVLLAQKLEEELNYENEEAAPEEPEFLTTFKSHGIWKIQDTLGSNDVVLTRQFGNENIRLTFSIVDIQSQENPEELTEEGEEETPADDVPNDLMRVSVSITKSANSGALEFDMTLEAGHFLVENVSHYPDGKLSHEVSLENDWKRRGLYIGPEFTTLDVAVQEQFEKFLEERDIGESLSFFIPEYAQHKEQKEYINWLQNVKSFVDA